MGFASQIKKLKDCASSPFNKSQQMAVYNTFQLVGAGCRLVNLLLAMTNRDIIRIACKLTKGFSGQDDVQQPIRGGRKG